MFVIHVAHSRVCVWTSLCWAHGWTVQKRLNWVRGHLGIRLVHTQETFCVRWVQILSMEGKLLMHYVLVCCTLPLDECTVHWLSTQCQWRTSSFIVASGNKVCKVNPDDCRGEYVEAMQPCSNYFGHLLDSSTMCPTYRPHQCAQSPLKGLQKSDQ